MLGPRWEVVVRAHVASGEVDPLGSVDSVGVTSGASVPEILVRDVLRWLAERGYADVQEVTTAEESLTFALPRELRTDLKAAGLPTTGTSDHAWTI